LALSAREIAFVSYRLNSLSFSQMVDDAEKDIMVSIYLELYPPIKRPYSIFADDHFIWSCPTY